MFNVGSVSYRIENKGVDPTARIPKLLGDFPVYVCNKIRFSQAHISL